MAQQWSCRNERSANACESASARSVWAEGGVSACVRARAPAHTLLRGPGLGITSVQIDDTVATEVVPRLPAARSTRSRCRTELHANTHIRIAVRDRNKCFLPLPEPRRRAKRGCCRRIQVDDVGTPQSLIFGCIPAAWRARSRRRTKLHPNTHIGIARRNGDCGLLPSIFP